MKAFYREFDPETIFNTGLFAAQLIGCRTSMYSSNTIS